jgi:hypothetical protein
MNAVDEAWQRYLAASYAQLNAVAAMAEIPDIDDLEEQLRECD